MARKFTNGIDLMGTEAKNVKFQLLPTDPEGAGLWTGRVWVNTTEGKIKMRDATDTIVIGSVNIDSNTALWKMLPSAGDEGLIVTVGPDGKLALLNGLNGIQTFSGGIPSEAVAGVDYTTPDSNDTLTNKNINAPDNNITNLESANFHPAAICLDIPTAQPGQLANAEAVKAWVEELLAAIGRWAGPIDVSSGNLPTASVGGTAIQGGDYWRVTVAGDIVGLGHLEIGDVLVANIDGATVAADFFVLQGNIVNAVMYDGLAAAPEDGELAIYSGTTGKLLKNSGASMQADGLHVKDVHTDVYGSIETALEAIDNDISNLATSLATSLESRPVHIYRDILAANWTGPVNGEYSIMVDVDPDTTQLTSPVVVVRDSTGDEVEVDTSVGASRITLTAAAPFDGRVTVIDRYVPGA